MASEWKTVRAADFIEFNPRLSIKKGAMATKVAMDKLQPFTKKIPATEQVEFAGGSKFCNGDTIMARITPCLENGKTAFVDILADGEVAFGSTEFIVMRARADISDPQFVYYLATSPAFRNVAIKSMVGSSGRQRVQQGVLDELELIVPPLEEQQKIGAMLAMLDHKIALNNKINDNLQQQARALFFEWFIKTPQDCDTRETELGLLPADYSVIKTGELPMIVTDYVANGSFASLKENVQLYQERNYAYFIRNTDLKAGTFEVFVDEHSYNFLAKSRLFGGEIIISNVGDVGSVFLCPKLDAPMTLGNNIIMLKPSQDELRYYLYIWFKWSMGQGLIQGIKGGSAQPKFNKTDFKSLPVILPPQDILHRFHETVCPMFEAIDANQAENRRLAALRDTVLPKLMSGEIDVSDIDI